MLLCEQEDTAAPRFERVSVRWNTAAVVSFSRFAAKETPRFCILLRGMYKYLGCLCCRFRENIDDGAGKHVCGKLLAPNIRAVPQHTAAAYVV